MTTITELMATDPMKLTKQDITQLVDYMRKNRKNFLVGASLPKKTSNASVSIAGEISLEGLK